MWWLSDAVSVTTWPQIYCQQTWKRCSLDSQGPSLSSNGLLNGLAAMAWLLTM